MADRSAPEMTTEEQIAALRHLVEQQASQLAVQNDALSALTKATGGLTILPPEETPIYEIGPGHYYSPDDVFYPEGTQIEDITGQIIPNENMIPLNEPATRRMEKYLRTLPQMGTPNMEFIIEAAMSMRPREGDDPIPTAQYHASILEKAMLLKAKAEGRLPADAVQPKIPVRVQREGAGGVPIMSNSRIRQGDPTTKDMVGVSPSSNAGPRRTRQRAPATAAADKTAPALGTVQSLPLGSEPQGVKV